MKVLDVTEFYSERGGGVRSHLTLKSHVLCQLGHEHVVLAPGPHDCEEDVPAAKHGANRATQLHDTAFMQSGDARRETSTHDRPSAGTGGRARVIRMGGPSLPYDPTYHLLWRIDKIRAIVARERPDVLEIHSPYVAAAGALAVPRAHFGVRTFCWHSDFIDTYLRVFLEKHVPSGAADLALAPLWALVRGIARGCDATFVSSRGQAEKLRAHGLPRITHVPFGIERTDFSPTRASDARRRELLGPKHRERSETTHLLVGVGRFAVEKRWDVVLDAFVRLKRTHSAVLVLFGDGPERERLASLVAGRDDVVLAGFERDRVRLASALASADALVHACPYETFGLSIAEAMSCGLPVVVPDRGGAAELADPACSETYRSLDAGECCAAIERILARDRASLRVAAARAAERIPNVREQFALLCQEYARLLADPPRVRSQRGARPAGESRG